MNLALAILALLIIFEGVINLYRVLIRRHWPSTVAVIARAIPTELATFSDWFDQAVLGRSRSDESHARAQVLCYVYALEGFKYVGTRLHAAPTWPLARNRISGLDEGEKVRVFHHPKYPHIAFLAQSYAWPALLRLAVGAALFLLVFMR